MLLTVNLNLEKDRLVTPHFKVSEFMCPHCRITKIETDLIELIEKLRIRLGNRPIKITSGYRCSVYNKQVGGYYKSRHLISDAADLRLWDKDSIPYYVLVEEALKIFPRVGVYPQRFIHVDLSDSPTKYWYRTWNGRYIYPKNQTQLLSMAKQYTV